MSDTECTCSADIATKLAERFKETQPEATDHRVRLEGYCFSVMGNSMVLRPYMQYKATATHPLKKGGAKEKTVTGNMIFSYCPFCGVKFPKSEES